MSSFRVRPERRTVNRNSGLRKGGRGCISGRSKECNYIAVSGDSCRNGCEETADQPCTDRCFIPCRHWMADSGGTDIVAGMAAVPAAGSGISDAQLYITGTGGIRGRPSASDGWNLAGIWADVRRSDAGTHSLFGTLRSPSDAEENTETGFHTAGAVSAAWICGEVRNALKVKMRKASITVEAVLVVPLVLMVIFLLLSLTFFVHARSWYTFAAYESTMLAASEGRLSVEKGEAAAQSRMEWWISQIPLPAEPVTVQTVCREKEIQIKAEGNILPIWSRNAWEYSVLSESRRNNPVKTIRKIRAVKQIWNQK